MKIRTVLNYDHLFKHAALIGSTGSGKSSTMLAIIEKVILNKQQNKLVIVDGKNDSQLFFKLKNLAERYHYKFCYFFNADQIHSSFNYCSLISKNQEQILEQMNRLRIKENTNISVGAQYYLNLSNKLIDLVVQSLMQKNIEVNWNNLLYYTDRKRLGEIIEQAYYLKGLTEETYCEVRDFFKPFLNLNNHKEILSLQNFLTNRENEIILFSLDFLTYPSRSKDLAQMICLDLRQCIVKKQTDLFLVLDEFGSYVNSDLLTILEQGRSYHTGLILAFQSLGQINGKLSFKQTLFDNINNWFIFNLKDDYSATEMSKLFGFTKQLATSYSFNLQKNRITNSTYHSVDVCVVSPQEIKELKPGQCFVKTIKTPRYYCESLEED